MNTRIKATTITLTPALTGYISKRLEKIDHILKSDPSIQCDIEVARTTNHHNKGEVFAAELHIVGHKQNAFAKSEKADVHMAIDDVVDEVFRSLTSRRKKYIAMARRGGARMKDMIKGLWPSKAE